MRNKRRPAKAAFWWSTPVVEEAVDRMLEYDVHFIEAVEEGRASARRGDLMEHDEVVERIDQMFH